MVSAHSEETLRPETVCKKWLESDEQGGFVRDIIALCMAMAQARIYAFPSKHFHVIQIERVRSLSLLGQKGGS